MKQIASGISVRDQVAARIRQAIIRGDLAPGDHLPEQALAERYSVSRSPVREALAVLQRLGLVEYQRNRGMFVAELDVAELAEIYRLRAVLEGLIASLAAERCTATDVAELREINRAMSGSLNDTEKFISYNVAFHRQLHSITSSPVTARIIEDLWDRSERFRRTTFLSRDAMLESVHDHEMLIYALEHQDVNLARHLGSLAVRKRFPDE